MNTENDLVAKCPQCGSVFRLTAQHLQAAKGWVQCGMCGNVFHSGLKPAEPPAPQPAASAAPQVESTPAQEAAAEAGQGPGAEAAAAEPHPAGAEAAAAGLPGLAQRMAEDQQEEETPSAFGPKLESIILVDPNLPQADEDYGPMPVFEPAPEKTRPEPAAPAFKAIPQPPAGIGARQSTATSTGWIPRRPQTRPTVRPQKKRHFGWLWALLILLLLLALGAQLAFYLRDKLAANYPGLRPQLAQACAVLGCSLSLPRDPHKVVILGSDLQTEHDGLLNLEITLANRATYAMAWPVLELTLTDVEDQPLARRMFAPSEYLPSGDLASAGIPARAEVPFQLQLQSKGLKAAGYRLRMFY